MLPRNTSSAILDHSGTTNSTVTLDLTNSVRQEWEKIISHHLASSYTHHLAPLNQVHSTLHGSCMSEEPCTLVTYLHALQHRMNSMKQVWLQEAADGITKSSTENALRKVQHACAWQFVF